MKKLKPGVTKELPCEIERSQSALKCPCGGYAEKVRPTKDEIKQYNCGRSYNCCAVAFVCCVCKQRYAGSQPAPEME